MMSAQPVPRMGVAIIGGVRRTLKSQLFRSASSTTLVTLLAPGLAPAVPAPKVIVGKVNNVTVAADIPQTVSALIRPPSVSQPYSGLFPLPNPRAGIDGIRGIKTFKSCERLYWTESI